MKKESPGDGHLAQRVVRAQVNAGGNPLGALVLNRLSSP